jgi:Uma2 family endonuclease
MRVMEKVDEYLQQGVSLVWVVIASTREVLVCTKESKFTVRDKLTASGLLPDFELEVNGLFEGIETRQTAG